jgi:NUMOD3 motif
LTFKRGHKAWNKGKRLTEEHKRKLSKLKLGKPRPHKSHPHTEESKRKISMANRGKPKPPWTEGQRRKLLQAMSGPNNPNYGKRFSEEAKQKMRYSHAHAHNSRRKKGRIPWNKNKLLSRQHRKHIAEARKGKPHPHK